MSSDAHKINFKLSDHDCTHDKKYAEIEGHIFILERTLSFFHALLYIDGKNITSVSSEQEAAKICNEFLSNLDSSTADPDSTSETQ